MSDEQPPSKDELSSGKESLAHVETKTATSERRAVLSCTKCGATQDFPICDECGEPMDLESGKLIHHGKEMPVPTHCNESMTPKIV